MRTDHYELNGCPIAVITLWNEPEECGQCGKLHHNKFAVPWYYEPVAEGCSDGGYKTVCKSCYDKWDVKFNGVSHE